MSIVGEMKISAPAAFEEEGGFQLNVSDFNGSPGEPRGWDAADVQGKIVFVEMVPGSYRVTLEPVGDFCAGLLSTFDPKKCYALPFLSATRGIVGFHPTTVRLDTSRVKLGGGLGEFSVQQIGNALNLVYSPRRQSSTPITVQGQPVNVCAHE